jgi:lysophospholipase L1-like esterase
MFECLIVGDSIGVGIANIRKECISYVKGGINSKQWLDKNVQHTPLIAKHVIISLGSNDHKYIKTEAELRTIRELTKANKVFWVMPSTRFPVQREAIMKIANEYHDTVLKTERMQQDNVHPSWAGYKELAKASE